MNGLIAVFDVGKTNKKIVLFDRAMQIVESVQQQFGPEERTNLDVEPLHNIRNWFLDTLSSLSKRYTIAAISVTTHGGNFVGIDCRGNMTFPVLSYTNEPGKAFQDEFYETMGDPQELHVACATPPFENFINQGKNIYFVKNNFPEAFAATCRILNYPQYFGYILTGNMATELTSIGCHTYLWDFQTWGWSSVAKKLGVDRLYPGEMKRPYEILGTVSAEVVRKTGLHPDTIVTVGSHDSNASLIPYMITSSSDFLLNSTGTWCVALHPEREAKITGRDTGKLILYNISVFEKPVRTAIFMGGTEFETYWNMLKSYHGLDRLPPFQPRLYREVLKDSSCFIFPGIVKGGVQFPNSKPGVYENQNFYPLADIESGCRIPEFFKRPNYAYAVLNISLALQSAEAFKNTHIGRETEIVTTGGFTKNKDYNALLKALLPENNVSTSSITEATALGASLLARCSLENKPLSAFDEVVLENRLYVPSVDLPQLSRYRQKFLSILDVLDRQN